MPTRQKVTKFRSDEEGALKKLAFLFAWRVLVEKFHGFVKTRLLQKSEGNLSQQVSG